MTTATTNQPKITNVKTTKKKIKGEEIYLTLENVTIKTNNTTKPFYNKDYQKYTSYFVIEVTEELKNNLYAIFAKTFKNRKNLQVALNRFFNNRIVKKDDVEVLYVNLYWRKECTGTLFLEKDLPVLTLDKEICEKIETGEFPNSFLADVNLYFNLFYGNKIICCLSEILIKEVYTWSEIKNESINHSLNVMTKNEYDKALFEAKEIRKMIKERKRNKRKIVTKFEKEEEREEE